MLKALKLYGIGFGTAAIIYAISGHSYSHAPGFHHLIIFLTILIGFIWTLVSVIKLFKNNKEKGIKGFILINLIVIAGVVSYVVHDIKKNNSADYSSKSKENSLQKEIKGDTITIYHNGNIVYYKIKDSVLIDFLEGRDSH